VTHIHQGGGTVLGGTIARATVDIDAPPKRVWAALTVPDEIAVYMEGARVETTWQVGSAITWTGEYNEHSYQDRGEVLIYDKPRVLSVTHYSPLLGHEDRPENYHTLVYTLSAYDGGTRLSLTQDNCANDEQAEQFGRHWLQMLRGLKSHVER
jgi:uncharacterized protein YndB with AHSA1/START domain